MAHQEIWKEPQKNLAEAEMFKMEFYNKYKNKHIYTVLLFFLISCLQYIVLTITISFTQPIEIYVCYISSFFVIGFPIFKILQNRTNLLHNRVFRILAGIVIGIVATQLCLAFYQLFSPEGLIYAIGKFIKNIQRFGMENMIFGILFKALFCGAIFPGCFYAEVVYRLLTPQKPFLRERNTNVESK